MVAIGVGGMACPSHHGAWADTEALEQLRVRLGNAAAIHGESSGERFHIRPEEIAEELRHRHPREIDCPDCGTRLAARVAIAPGEAGLAGMACPNHHGAWIDQDTLHEIRKHLDTAAGTRGAGETHK